MSKIKKRCKDCCDDVCDFCIHFLLYRDKNGYNLDGTGWCGLARNETDVGCGCKNFYCKHQWRKNQ